MRSCSDVHNFLAEAGVPHEILHLPGQSRTAKAAAQQLEVALHEIVKSLVFFLDGVATLVLVPGDTRADPERIKAATGTDQLVLAKGKQVFDATGYRAGAVPPCGLVSELPVVADAAVFELPIVYCGGGTTATMLKVRSEDLQRLLSPVVAHIARPLPAEN